MTPDPIHPIEVIWTVISFVGGAMSVYGVVDCVLDLRALKGERNGRWHLGIVLLINEALRFLIQAIYLALGISLLFQENELRFSYFIGVLIATNFLLMVKTILGIWARRSTRRSAHDSVPFGRRKEDYSQGDC